MRKQWFNNVAFQWLIEGHLMPEKAIEIAKNARATFAQNNLNAQDMAQVTQMSNIPNSVINYAQMNPRTEDAINPNSAIMSYF